jgi:rubrerythrin
MQQDAQAHQQQMTVERTEALQEISQERALFEEKLRQMREQARLAIEQEERAFQQKMDDERKLAEAKRKKVKLKKVGDGYEVEEL